MSKIAVVAVHGVAHHEPGESARAMVELLQSPITADRYGSFEADTIHVRLRPVEAQLATPAAGAFRFLKERSAAFATYLAQSPRDQQPATHGRVGVDFMRLLLSGYRGGARGNTYVTTRLRGRRIADPGHERDVHVYEAYWADLARPNNTLLSFFFALFQLLLHMGSLSRLALDTGAAENPGTLWTALRNTQDWAVRMLQVAIPLLNLVLLVAALSILPLQLPESWWNAAVLAGAGVLSLGAGFIWCRPPARSGLRGPVGWTVLPALVVTAGVAVAWHLAPVVGWLALAAIEWWLIGALMMKFVLDRYDNVRAGVREIGWTLYAGGLMLFIVFFLDAGAAWSAPEALATATLWTMQWILAALRVSWLILFLCAFVACALGSIAWRRFPRGSDERARAHAAVRMSRLTLALPSLLMLLLVIFLWGGLFNWTTKHFPRPAFADVYVTEAPGSSTPGLASLFLNPKDIPALFSHASKSSQANTAENYLAGALVWSVGPGLVVSLVTMLAAFFVLTWWVLPSVSIERFPGRGQAKPPRASTNVESERLGAWLSRGLDALPVVTLLFWAAIFLIPSIFIVWHRVAPSHPTLVALNRWTDFIVSWTAGLTASLAVLGIIVRYTSSALGIVLDVDNYLRTLPAESTPRAMIAERYVSLLRYLAAHRDDGQGYDAVIIVAHSLGALISEDLLLYLRAQGEAELRRLGYGTPGGNAPEIPVALFTMGNPLRQLLDRFFPYLYDWVRLRPDGGEAGLGPPRAGSTSDEIRADALPSAGDIGVARWVNAYRSGDYVGRSLWLDESYRRTLDDATSSPANAPLHVVDDAKGERAEMCIGAGAHQHYWDDTAPDIASALDSLIRAPARRC